MRIVLADEENLCRDALVALLEREPDIEVVAAVGNADDAVAQTLKHQPDLVLLDAEMSGRDGIDAAADIRALMDTPIVIIISQARPAVLRRALQAEVAGVVAQNTPAERLIAILRDAQQGKRYIDPETAVLAQREAQCRLTPREIQALRLTLQGIPTAAIAEHARLTAGTVRNYLSSAMAKLEARNRFEAARIAADQGWI